MSYNGWTNYETWNVPLWLDNDESLYHAKLDFIGGFDDPDEIDNLNVEAFCRETFPNGTPDMDGAADMDKVDWAEIAEHWQIEWRETFVEEDSAVYP